MDKRTKGAAPVAPPQNPPKRDLTLTIARAEAVLKDPTHAGVCSLRECLKREMAGDIVYMAGQIAAHAEFELRATKVLAAALRVNETPDSANLQRLKVAIADCPEMRDAAAHVKKLGKLAGPVGGKA